MPSMREAQHLRQRILALAGEARRAMVGNRDLPEARPAHEPAHEAIALRHGAQRVDHATVHQPEVARVERDARVRETIRESDRTRAPSRS